MNSKSYVLGLMNGVTVCLLAFSVLNLKRSEELLDATERARQSHVAAADAVPLHIARGIDFDADHDNGDGTKGAWLVWNEMDGRVDRIWFKYEACPDDGYAHVADLLAETDSLELYGKGDVGWWISSKRRSEK